MNKDFNDFLATLNEDTFMHIANSVNSTNHTFNFSMDQDGFKNLFTAIGITDIHITLEILKLYHEWLNS